MVGTMRTVRNQIALLVFGLAIVAGGSLAFAAETGNSGEALTLLTLEEAINLALTSDPVLLASGEKENAARAHYNQIESSTRPRITLEGTASASSTASLNDLMSEAERTDNTSGAITLTWKKPLAEDSTLKNSLRQAEAALEIARNNHARTRSETVYRAMSAYYAVLKAAAQFEVAEKALAKADESLEIAEKRLADGVGTNLDLLKARMAKIEAERALKVAESRLIEARTSLARMLGMDRSDFRVDAGAAYAEAYAFYEETAIQREEKISALESMVAAALESRPEIKSASESLEKARLELESARKDLGPEIKLWGKWEAEAGSIGLSLNEELELGITARYSDSFSETAAFSGGVAYEGIGLSSEPDNLWSAGVSLTWTPLDGGLSRSRIEEYEANLREATLELEGQIRAVEDEVRAALNDLTEVTLSVESARLSRDLATETAKVARLEFESGTAAEIELIEAELAASQAEAALRSAIYDYRLAYARLQKSLGASVDGR